jgi:hypothetical protein
MTESRYQVKVPIFKQFHKFVIGKGGANIRRISRSQERAV